VREFSTVDIEKSDVVMMSSVRVSLVVVIPNALEVYSLSDCVVASKNLWSAMPIVLFFCRLRTEGASIFAGASKKKVNASQR
jgi:hypothetical protein